MSEPINNVYYDKRTGRVLNDELAQLFDSHDLGKMASIGIMAKEEAVIQNGFVTNMPNAQKSQGTPNSVGSASIPPIQPTTEVERMDRPAIIYYDEQELEKLLKPFEVDEVYARLLDPNQDIDLNKLSAYNRAKRKSHAARKQSTLRDRNKTKEFAVKFGIWIVSVIMVLGFYIGVRFLSQISTEHQQLKSANNSIVSMLEGETGKHYRNIVNRNRYATDDHKGYWFDNKGIAEDILALPDNLFDVALYVVYEDMGNEASNAYKSNINEVIQYLNSAVQDPNDRPLTFARIHNCQSFSDFLMKNGFVDEHGFVSMDLYLNHGKALLDVYQNYLTLALQKNSNLTDAAPNLGGR